MNRELWLCLLATVTCLGCASSEAVDVSAIDPALCVWEEALSAEDLTDFSDFTSFSFRRPGAYEDVVAGSIVPSSSGLVYTASVLRQVEVEPGECEEPLMAHFRLDCVREVELPARLLGPQETECVLNAFGSVEINRGEFCTAIDPYFHTTFQWDDFEVNTFFCTPVRINFSASEHMVDIFTELSGAFE